jgi:hypothetical protein
VKSSRTWRMKLSLVRIAITALMHRSGVDPSSVYRLLQWRMFRTNDVAVDSPEWFDCGIGVQHRCGIAVIPLILTDLWCSGFGVFARCTRLIITVLWSHYESTRWSSTENDEPSKRTMETVATLDPSGGITCSLAQMERSLGPI